MDLAEFLLSRIAEDEEAAEAAVRHWHDDCLDAPVAQVELHAYRHAPARVLAECEAKRQVIDWTQTWRIGPSTGDALLRALSLPYAAHPEYRQEWRPDLES